MLESRPDVPVQIVAVEGHPAQVLAQRSQGADLLVVGARGRGAGGWLLGSVSREVAQRAKCSVAVVRCLKTQAQEHAHRAEWKRIVVGVDGSEHSQRALRWASEEASKHSADLLAVSVWTPPPPTIAPPFGSFPWGADANREEHAKAMLERAVRAVFRADPPGHLQTDITEGNAAKVLIELAREADLLVVGSRGHGGFTGMLLGSLSQHVAAHAACSVIIVR
jgi:nucleotide-binding universal stress UspA family protein